MFMCNFDSSVEFICFMVLILYHSMVVYNFWTGSNGLDQTEGIKLGLDWTRLLSAHVL